MKLLAASATLLAAAWLAISAEAPKVTYFDAAAVTAAFQKGGVLYKGNSSYQVHASRREAPGGAEIHAKDSDIIYVLQGTATFVTGGQAVEPKAVGPGEMIGKEIAGGDVRQLNKGDVIIVPAGTPHWFKQVTNPFLYYVVKAQ